MSVRGANVYGGPRGARPCAAAAAMLWLVGTTAVAGPPPAAGPEGRPPLDLRLGDLRRYVPPEELHAPWTADLDEVLVQSRRRSPDLPERRAVPQGLGGLFWAARRPTESWRLFVPDPNAAAVPPRSPDDPQPPPGSWRLRLDQNGKVW